jgi:catechol 2,3-dioxygenase-like lactoylglutathione lyase family enzyme
MLGRFLEFSVHCADVAQSLEFYQKLGFTQAPVGETWKHHYAVVTDGRLCIGLHGEAPASAALTFVRPDILRHATLLESRGLELELRRVGDAVFNEIGFVDPCGMLVRMIEARTFSPSERKSTELSSCGYFEEIALPAADMNAAKAFWEDKGFVGMDELEANLPHVSCTSDFVDVGLYDARQLREPALVFEADDIHTRMARLAAAGIEPDRSLLPALRGMPAALYVAPEGTRLLMRGLAG